MMIPLSRILAEIEKQASAARLHGADESNIRESLVAIRALCDVALDNRSRQSQPVQVLETQTIRTAEPLKDDDANGDSLFDF